MEIMVRVIKVDPIMAWTFPDSSRPSVESYLQEWVWLVADAELGDVMADISAAETMVADAERETVLADIMVPDITIPVIIASIMVVDTMDAETMEADAEGNAVTDILVDITDNIDWQCKIEIVNILVQCV
ncbi:hypothetical protein KR009_007457 [Drosophila setifemur]|nr:hypothetical protein KR009_007457 [Drosophila setifemur]